MVLTMTEPQVCVIRSEIGGLRGEVSALRGEFTG